MLKGSRMDEVFPYFDGLEKMAENISGRENVLIGIRPHGFHVGNALPLLIYPWLLCERLECIGKTPKLRFNISINDMEPFQLKYLFLNTNGEAVFKSGSVLSNTEETPFEYNVFPEDTTFQHTLDPFGCCRTIVDHWQNILHNELSRLSKSFPKTKVKFVRNSEISQSLAFEQALKCAFECNDEIAFCVEKHTQRAVSRYGFQLAGAVCPICKSAQGKTILKEKECTFQCNRCHGVSNGELKVFDWWMHHLLLFPPRVKQLNIDLCIRGGDHFNQSHTHTTSALYEMLYGKKTCLKTLVTPLVVDSHGRKVSKSSQNEVHLPFESLLELARKCKTERLEVFPIEDPFRRFKILNGLPSYNKL